MKLQVKEETNNGELTDIYYDITLIVNKSGELIVIDNTQQDCTDFVDCGTVIMTSLKLRPQLGCILKSPLQINEVGFLLICIVISLIYLIFT